MKIRVVLALASVVLLALSVSESAYPAAARGYVYDWNGRFLGYVQKTGPDTSDASTTTTPRSTCPPRLACGSRRASTSSGSPSDGVRAVGTYTKTYSPGPDYEGSIRRVNRMC
jgi:hypothetical protein